jgi:tetratricopeptide (TPR) repeat protein
MFRTLGLHRGPDITVPAAASMAGIPVADARPALAELSRSHLITERIPGRFSFHDLLRSYAIEQAEICDPPAGNSTSVLRLLDHYLRTAYSAALLLHPRRSLITPGSPQPGVVPEKPRSYAEAWAWFEAEGQVLLSLVQLAAATGSYAHAWQLPWAIGDFHRRRGHWQEWLAAHQTALSAARHIPDKQGEAHALRGLGRALSRLSRTNAAYAGQADEARTYLTGALSLFEELNDVPGQAFTHIDLSWDFGKEGNPDCLEHARQALVLARSCGHIQAQARALNTMAWRHVRRGQYADAIKCGDESLALSLESGDRRGEADTMHAIGDAHLALGHHERAAGIHQQSLALHRELGERYGQAQILTHVGETQHAAGDTESARATLHLALGILGEIGLGRSEDGYPSANHIRALLGRLASIEGSQIKSPSSG